MEKSLYHTEHGEKKEEQRIVWEFENQNCGKAMTILRLKSISRDLDVPVSTVRNVIKKFTAHGTVANLPGRGQKRKIDERLQRRIVWMVDKEPRSTSKQIQADLQTQGTTVSTRTIRRDLNEMGRYGRRPRRTPLLAQRHEKCQTRVCQNLPEEAKILIGERHGDR